MASPGLLAFWALIAVMLITAGGAAAPPVRNRDVLRGALIMLTGVAIMIPVQNFFGSMASVDAFFLLDALYALGFYLIARPRPSDTPATIRQRDWASRVCLIFLYIILVEMTHFGATRTGPWAAFVEGLVFALAALIIIGAARARGIRGFLAALALSAMTVHLALTSFVFFLNCLTALAIAQITFEGGRSSFENLATIAARSVPKSSRPGSFGAFARRLARIP